MLFTCKMTLFADNAPCCCWQFPCLRINCRNRGLWCRSTVQRCRNKSLNLIAIRLSLPNNIRFTTICVLLRWFLEHTWDHEERGSLLRLLSECLLFREMGLLMSERGIGIRSACQRVFLEPLNGYKWSATADNGQILFIIQNIPYKNTMRYQWGFF